MWQRFTVRARRVLLRAQGEADDEGSGRVGTEHLLLGILLEDDCLGLMVLTSAGVSPAAVRSRLLARRIPDSTLNEQRGPLLDQPAKNVLQLAADESKQLDHDHIGTEHLLLGLLREEGGLARAVLTELGLDLKTARKLTRSILPKPATWKFWTKLGWFKRGE